MAVDDRLNDSCIHILILLALSHISYHSCFVNTSEAVLSFINSFTFMIIEYGKCIWILPFGFSQIILENYKRVLIINKLGMKLMGLLC